MKLWGFWRRRKTKPVELAPAAEPSIRSKVDGAMQSYNAMCTHFGLPEGAHVKDLLAKIGSAGPKRKQTAIRELKRIQMILDMEKRAREKK